MGGGGRLWMTGCLGQERKNAEPLGLFTEKHLEELPVCAGSFRTQSLCFGTERESNLFSPFLCR